MTTCEPSVQSNWRVSAAHSGQTIKMIGIPGITGAVDVMIDCGHGVLGSSCGGVALVRNAENGVTHYTAIMEVDIRAWSHEISNPANTYLLSTNFGGRCDIPDVTQLKQEDFNNIMQQWSK